MEPQQPPPQPAPQPPQGGAPQPPPQSWQPPPQDAPQQPPSQPAPGRRNPWLSTMGIVSGVIVLLGIFLMSLSTSELEQSLTDGNGLVVLNIGLAMVTGGVVGIFLTFAVAALRWRPRR